MKKQIIIFILMVLVNVVAVDAQINIRLSRVNVPQKEEIRTPEVPTDASSPMNTQRGSSPTGSRSNRQIVIDDGYTFFDAEPLQEYSNQLRRQVGIGWYLRSHLRMFGTVPNRSAFNVVVSKGGKELSRTRCEGRAYRKAEDPVPANQKSPDDDYLFTDQRGCEDKTKVIKETGKLDVKVYFINGNTDEEKLLRTYKIDVREATRVRGSATAPVPDVPHYYIQRHAETAAAILFIRPIGPSQNLVPNYHRVPGEGDFHSELDIYFNISPKKQTDRIPHANLRCSVNGTPLNFPGRGDHSDQTRIRMKRLETAIYTDRLAAEYKRANEYMDEVSFVLYQVRLPLLLKGDPQNFRLGVSDNRGNWECSIRYNGETIRTFRWVIGANGLPVQHAEQTSGNINLAHNAFLIDVEVPTGGSSFDHRLLPLPNEGIFYGIPLRSSEAKATASKVPTKGRPYHVPSTTR